MLDHYPIEAEPEISDKKVQPNLEGYTWYNHDFKLTFITYISAVI